MISDVEFGVDYSGEYRSSIARSVTDIFPERFDVPSTDMSKSCPFSID